jgi:enoyl-CoA hydratase/carnithine racemase
LADLKYGVENGVGTILLNRPEKKNAFTTQMLGVRAEMLVEARTDESATAASTTSPASSARPRLWSCCSPGTWWTRRRRTG